MCVRRGEVLAKVLFYLSKPILFYFFKVLKRFHNFAYSASVFRCNASLFPLHEIMSFLIRVRESMASGLIQASQVVHPIKSYRMHCRLNKLMK